MRIEQAELTFFHSPFYHFLWFCKNKKCLVWLTHLVVPGSTCFIRRQFEMTCHGPSKSTPCQSTLSSINSQQREQNFAWELCAHQSGMQHEFTARGARFCLGTLRCLSFVHVFMVSKEELPEHDLCEMSIHITLMTCHMSATESIQRCS